MNTLQRGWLTAGISYQLSYRNPQFQKIGQNRKKMDNFGKSSWPAVESVVET